MVNRSWDTISTFSLFHHKHWTQIRNIALFSPNGKVLAVIVRSGITLYDTQTGRRNKQSRRQGFS